VNHSRVSAPGRGGLPPVLCGLLHDLVWCEEAKGYVEIGEAGRVVLTKVGGRRWLMAAGA